MSAREQNDKDGYLLVQGPSPGNTVEVENEAEAAGTPAGIENHGTDLYDAVAVAAFGGVTQLLDGCEPSLVHPMFLFLLSIPLLIAQMSALFYLRLDLDLTEPVHSTSSNADKRDMLLALKMLMVVIVQLFMFSRLMGTVQQFVFLVNPTTWEDIHRPDPATFKMRFGWIFRPIFTAPPAILAILAHLLVDYNICIDSVSIILGSTEVKHAIYDSLAITFIADLSAMWWGVTSTVFHFESFADFQFTVGSDKWRKDVRENAWFGIPTWLRKIKFLERGHGGKSLELGMTFLFMFIIYFRQVLVVAHAVHTNILPVARDVCTLWQVQSKGEDGRGVAEQLFTFVESHLLLSDPTGIVEDVADPDHYVNGHRAGYCNSTYDRLTVSKFKPLFHEQPMFIWGSLVVILVFLGLPQVHYLSYWYIRKLLYPENIIKREELAATRFRATHRTLYSVSRDSHDESPLRAEVDDLRKEVQELKVQLAKLLVR